VLADELGEQAEGVALLYLYDGEGGFFIWFGLHRFSIVF
jgi:hypothetical protein